MFTDKAYFRRKINEEFRRSIPKSEIKFQIKVFKIMIVIFIAVVIDVMFL